MSASRFFEYCRMAYIAARRKEDKVDTSLSGHDMYARYADGRHEGLLDIDPNSPQEFADWIDGKHPKRSTGDTLGRSNAAATPPTSICR